MRCRVLIIGVSLGIAAPAFAAPGEASFTPSNLYVPLRGVVLEDSLSHRSAELYRCAALTPAADGDAGAEDADRPSGDCLVDMADNAALQALFSSPIDIEPGTYDRIRLDNCAPGAMGYSSFVKGHAELNGTTYYTMAAGSGEVLTTSAAHAGYIMTDYNGCSSLITLPQPVIVAENDALNITAFFSLRNIAWATLTGNGPPGGCVFNPDHTQSVCTGYPIPIATIGADAASVDTFYITEDLADSAALKAAGQMLILRTPAGAPFGGFSRRLYSATSIDPSVNYDTPVKSIVANTTTPVSYTIETWGGGPPGEPPTPFSIHFPAFELQTHTGTLTREFGGTTDYRAVLQAR
jgi:hypothetical protein